MPYFTSMLQISGANIRKYSENQARRAHLRRCYLCNRIPQIVRSCAIRVRRRMHAYEAADDRSGLAATQHWGSASQEPTNSEIQQSRNSLQTAQDSTPSIYGGRESDGVCGAGAAPSIVWLHWAQSSAAAMLCPPGAIVHLRAGDHRIVVDSGNHAGVSKAAGSGLLPGRSAARAGRRAEAITGCSDHVAYPGEPR